MRRLQAASLAALGLAAAPGVALACPVCFASKDEANRLAFLGTTVFLTALPVLMIGGLIYWIARRSHALDTEHTAPAERQAPVPQHAAESSPASEPARQGELIPLRPRN